MTLAGFPLIGSVYTSGTSPTAPLNVKAPRLIDAPPNPDGSSVVAGSPGCSGVAPVYRPLKTLGNCVPGRPRAMSQSPDNGPKENMNVCVPSAIVA